MTEYCVKIRLSVTADKPDDVLTTIQGMIDLFAGARMTPITTERVTVYAKDGKVAE